MKKILTLICTLLVAIVASAAINHNLNASVVLEKKPTTAKELDLNTVGIRQVGMIDEVTMEEWKAEYVAKRKKAAAADIVLNGEGFLVGPEYEAGEWYIALEAQGYTFRLCWYGDEDNYCGTYTFDDMSMEYSWGWYQSADMFYEIYFQDVTMTVSEKVESNFKQIVLDATILDTNERTYKLHAVHLYDYDKNIYTITTYCDNQMGSVDAPDSAECLDQVTITATPIYGYHFVQWSDGNTDNPRTLELTQDTILTAEFVINQYSITTTSSHAERGTTQGDTTVNYLEGITISAFANYGYHFTQWNDGNTDNPRVVKVTDNTTYTAQFDKNIYTITTNCNNNQMGSVSAPDSAEYLDEITISATANHGYHFVQWSDGITDNPRTLVLTQDTTFTTEFVQLFSGQCGDNLYWAYDEDSKKISITGSGDMYNYTKSTQPWLLFHEQITEVTTSNTTTSIGTSAFSGCSGLTSITIPNNITSIGSSAFYGCSGLTSVVWNAKSCADFSDDSAPFYGVRSQLTSFTFGDSVQHIPAYLCYEMNNLTSITIPNSVTSIGDDAFYNCSGLREISIGSQVKTIGAEAFALCPRIYEVTCLAPEPPIAEESSFTNYDAYFHAPCDAQRYYSVDPVWKKFHNVECIVTENTVMDDITITPSDCEATVVWLSHEQAATYSLVITKQGETYCTLTFNKYGQLINIALAPARARAKQDAAEYAETGYSFTITGLDAATTYDYTFSVLNNAHETIDMHSGKFTTMSDVTTDMDNVTSTTNVQKLIRNGQLLIIRDGKTYNAQGVELK